MKCIDQIFTDMTDEALNDLEKSINIHYEVDYVDAPYGSITSPVQIQNEYIQVDGKDASPEYIAELIDEILGKAIDKLLAIYPEQEVWDELGLASNPVSNKEEAVMLNRRFSIENMNTDIQEIMSNY